jgi:hypothetical protein
VISAHHAPLHWFNTHHKSIHYRQNHSSISSKNSRGKICFSFVISLFFFMVLVFSIANEPSQIVSIQTQLELKISKLASSSYTQFELVLQMSSIIIIFLYLFLYFHNNYNLKYNFVLYHIDLLTYTSLIL